MSKAYIAKFEDDELQVALVFGENANQAKNRSVGEFEGDVHYINVRVNRVPELDNQEEALRTNPHLEDLWYFNNGYGLLMDSSYTFDDDTYVTLTHNVIGDEICEYFDLPYETVLTLAQVEQFIKENFEVKK